MRANTICCIFELALEFSEQNFPIPCSAVAFDNSPRANIGVSFRAIIADSDVHCWTEGANRRRPCCLQRIPDNRLEIILGAIIHDITHYTTLRPGEKPAPSGRGPETGVWSGPLTKAGTAAAPLGRCYCWILGGKIRHALIWHNVSASAPALDAVGDIEFSDERIDLPLRE